MQQASVCTCARVLLHKAHARTHVNGQRLTIVALFFFFDFFAKNADKSQKWPLLNLVRQILNVYHYKMEPIRKADGYTLEGVKKYRRFFQIKKKHFTHDNTSENTKIILLENTVIEHDKDIKDTDEDNIIMEMS